jgi:secretion/DNA translocation related TadE-like protein
VNPPRAGASPVVGPAVRGARRVRLRREQGSGAVLVLGAVACVVVVLAGALVVTAAVRDAHRARSAADLGALAAAAGPAAGGAADCAAAAVVTSAGGARLRGCRALADGSVLVVVGVPVDWAVGWPGLPEEVTGAARAGPESLGR